MPRSMANLRRATNDGPRGATLCLRVKGDDETARSGFGRPSESLRGASGPPALSHEPQRPRRDRPGGRESGDCRVVGSRGSRRATARPARTGGEFRKPAHRLGGDLDLDGDEGLTRRLASLTAEGVHVELQGPLCPSHGLPAGPTVHVAAGYRGYGRHESAVLFSVRGHDVAQL